MGNSSLPFFLLTRDFTHDVLVIRYHTEMEGAVLLLPRKVNIWPQNPRKNTKSHVKAIDIYVSFLFVFFSGFLPEKFITQNSCCEAE